VISIALLLGSILFHADERTGTTLADTTPPLVGSVRVDQHGSGRVTISWTTDEPTTGWVEYGSKASPRVETTTGAPSREHRVRLRGLRRFANLHYSIGSVDSAGNETVVPRERIRTTGEVTGSGFEIAGRLEAWYPVTIRFPGPFADETDEAPNPFLDYRLIVDVTGPDGARIQVPGFFDGDGRGGSSGNQWVVRFPTHLAGTWSFVASFRSGPDVAIDLALGAGSPASFNGTAGTFEVLPRDPDAPGFYKWGKLVYRGEHYLEFVDGPYFIKGGSNSPENLLAYAAFDNTIDQGGINTVGLIGGLHRYDPHVADWGPEGLGSHADPLFRNMDTGIDSRGLVGALNYLETAHVNSLFFLPMNLGGDGWEVCPFVGYANTTFNKTHYDLSKLRQWNEVLEHSARSGQMVQFVLAETEQTNENWFDFGTLGRQRKLFFREMIARFGHLPAIKWNLSEECEFSDVRIAEFADYINRLDPYKHPLGFHVNLLPVDGESAQYDAVLGDPRFSTNSLQAIPYTASDLIEKWRADSAAAGRKWVVEFDEQLLPLTNTNAEELRKMMLYDTLFSGGHLEWYAGYQLLPLGGDLRIEDFRTREEMWNYTWYARKLLEENVPFWLMEPMDELVVGEDGNWGGAEVFALPGFAYAVYYPNASAVGRLDLTGTSGLFHARWYDPRTGRFVGSGGAVHAGAMVPVPPPPSQPSEDWVFLLRR